MKISGPTRDPAKRGQPKEWYLSYSAPKLKPGGGYVLDEQGKVVMQRHRPYYATRADAEADMPRIQEQFARAGAGEFMFDREAAADYETAKLIAPEVSTAEMARFWRLHHPQVATLAIKEWLQPFLDALEARAGKKTRHYRDLKSRLGQFNMVFGDRLPATITRQEIMDYLLDLAKGDDAREGRGVLNQKRAICNFFGWLVVDKRVLTTNPAAGIKKRQLPKPAMREIGFLSLDYTERFLRAAERYDPEMVAHEVVQLFAGVRADDEMADFNGQWVHANTREVVIPASIAKKERREVIGSLEDNFWSWWSAHGRTRSAQDNCWTSSAKRFAPSSTGYSANSASRSR